jgi:rhamnose transport system ATP-binding protein
VLGPLGPQDSRPILVQIDGLSKSYTGVKAVDAVSLDIESGEIHSLVGENGAGKSTLIKILGGVTVPDAGSVLVDGHPLRLGHVRASEAAGIAVVHQESTAFPDLGVEDNLFIGREPRRFLGILVDKKAVRSRTNGLLKEIGESFPLDRPMGEFSVAQQQMVAVARALSFKARLVILDEPTASLSAKEAAVLHRLIRQLKSNGVSVLLVSHRLDEVLELSDRVTVLRDGKYVETRRVREWTREGLIKSMVGRDLTESHRASSESTTGSVMLRVVGLGRTGLFDDVCLEVREGEVLGLGGLVGAGRSEVVETLFGCQRADHGTVEVAGKRLPDGSVRAAIAAGVALVPEDRQTQGLVLDLSVGQNIVLTVRARLARWGWIDAGSERTIAGEQMSALAVKAASSSIAARSLSGGNQQKVVLGKWLATRPKVLILDEPTRGVDVGAKAEIHRLVKELAAAGTAVLLVSSDLPELLALSDRVLVMRAGRVVGELVGAEANQEEVMRLALEPDSAVAS